MHNARPVSSIKYFIINKLRKTMVNIVYKFKNKSVYNLMYNLLILNYHG